MTDPAVGRGRWSTGINRSASQPAGMVSSRAATALAGVLVSLVVSVAAWVYFDTVLLFLLVPFVPFLFRGGRSRGPPSVSRCPVCGFETRDPSFGYCPRDGTALE